MATDDHHDCPGCGAGLTADRWCVVCGLDLQGEVAAGLRDLTSRLAATENELRAISARRDALTSELARRRWESDRRSAAAASPAPVPAFSFDRSARTGLDPEWSVEKVRNLLLWTGAALLALSALAFTAVAWTHLSPGGRAALLVVLTVVSAGTASALRTRLPATAGAFTGLTIALALVDWQIVRRAGVAPGLSTAAWWAIGTAVVGAVAAGLARVAAPVPARRVIVLLIPASAVLVIDVTAGASWSVAFALAVAALVLVIVYRILVSREIDTVVQSIVRVEAGALWVVGAFFALDAAIEACTFLQALTPAVAMLAFAFAPGVATVPVRGASDTGDRTPLAFLAVAAVIGAGLTLASTSIGSIGMITLGAVFGGIAIVVASRLGTTWGRGTYAAGIVAGAAGFIFAISEAAVAELGPLTWLGEAWTGSTSARAASVIGGSRTVETAGLGWCAVGILVVTAAAIALTSRGVETVRAARSMGRRGKRAPPGLCCSQSS